jgi:hypothetical protein
MLAGVLAPDGDETTRGPLESWASWGLVALAVIIGLARGGRPGVVDDGRDGRARARVPRRTAPAGTPDGTARRRLRDGADDTAAPTSDRGGGRRFSPSRKLRGQTAFSDVVSTRPKASTTTPVTSSEWTD